MYSQAFASPMLPAGLKSARASDTLPTMEQRLAIVIARIMSPAA
jgi:hypothetical protein